jgi:serine phosphatase RsbU (regulator of sigma subunit)
MDKAILSQVPLFARLPPAEIDILAQELREETYPSDTVLFREGDYGDRFFIVTEGEVAIIKAMDTPNERLVAIRGIGQFIGEMSLVNPDGLRTASARVHQKARLLALSRSDFHALLQREPDLAYTMLSVLSRRLNEAHNEAIRDLTEKNRQLAEAYENLKAAQEQIIEKKSLERELIQAREIQESMLPTVIPQLEGFDVGATMVPARMVGGDFYDVISFGPDLLGVVVGDVAGKGVPAALFMALTRSLLRVEARPSSPPERVLQHVNRHLLGMNAKGLFVTILYGMLDRVTRRFTYVRAGHEPPLLWDDKGKILHAPMGGGQALGFLRNPTLERMTLTVPQGGAMLLVSDGVTEASNPHGDLFGRARLEATIPSLAEEPAQALLNSLLQTLWDYQNSAHQADDITLIAIRADAASRI